MTAKKQRNSSVELLRLFSLFSITLCHTIGGDKGLSTVNVIYGVFANTFFNAGTGVVIFMLITGYFGAHLTQKRFNSVYSILYICSLAFLGISSIFTPPSLKKIALAFLPITANFLWYAGCYIFTLLLSPFLDRVAEKAEKKWFMLFLAVAILLFYVHPTFLYGDITGDRGKGITHMIIAYFIGRYLKRFPPKLSKKALAGIAGGSTLFAFAGNIAATVVRHGVISYPFSRDCSVTTLVTAAALLLWAVQNEFVIKPVNAISSKFFYIMLLSPHSVLRHVWDVGTYAHSPLFMPLTVAATLVAIGGAYLAALLLQYPALFLQKLMEAVENAVWKRIKDTRFLVKIKELTEN